MRDWFAHQEFKRKKIEKEKQSVMLETKTTLKTMGETICKEDCNLCMFTWLKAKIQIQFCNQKKKNHTTASLHKSTFYSNLFCKSYTINNFNKHIAKSVVYWNKLDVKPNIRLSRGSTNTFLAFWKDDWQ